MRRLFIGMAVVLGLTAVATPGRAQFFGNGTGDPTLDPFRFYYGIYLPRQAALAATPSPMATINAMSAARQEAALTERAGLYDPVSVYGPDLQYDPTRPFANRLQGRRPGGMAATGTNINGAGPNMYYNRTATYFPGLRAGRGTNRNVTVGIGSPRTTGSYGRAPAVPMGGIGAVPY